jgi:hypothetical protein
MASFYTVRSNMKSSFCFALVLFALARDVSAETITYREELVTENRTAQQRVIVPVREYRMQSRLTNTWEPIHGPSWVPARVPYYRWEERLQTTSRPMVRRAYRPVFETSTTPPRPVILAERPRRGAAAQSPRPYDNPPVVAVQPPEARTAQAPATILKPRELKPGR